MKENTRLMGIKNKLSVQIITWLTAWSSKYIHKCSSWPAGEVRRDRTGRRGPWLGWEGHGRQWLLRSSTGLGRSRDTWGPANTDFLSPGAHGWPGPPCFSGSHRSFPTEVIIWQEFCLGMSGILSVVSGAVQTTWGHVHESSTGTVHLKGRS